MAKLWKDIEKSEKYMSLSEEDKSLAKAEYWDSVITKKESYLKLSDEDKATAKSEFLGSPIETSSDVPVKDNSFNEAISTGAKVAAGATAYALGSKFLEPFGVAMKASRDLRKIEGGFNLPEQVPLKYVPQRIRMSRDFIMKGVRNAEATLKEGLREINTNSIPEKSVNLSNHIASNMQQFNRDLSAGYENAINNISNLADASGFRFTDRVFETEVLDKAISRAKESGVTDEGIDGLINAKNNLRSRYSIRDSKWNPFDDSFSLKDANGYIGKITSEKPYSASSAILRKTWKEFLDTASPLEIRPMIRKLNSQFESAVQLRTLVAKFTNHNTGAFDTKGLSGYIADYVKGSRGGDVEGAMRLLTEGNELVKPMPGIATRFQELNQLRNQRNTIMDQIKKTAISGRETDLQLSQKILDATDTLKILERANERIANRNLPGRLFRWVTGLGRPMGTALRAVGPAGMVLQAKDLAGDPAGSVYRMLGGVGNPQEEKARIIAELEQQMNASRQIGDDTKFIEAYRALGGI